SALSSSVPSCSGAVPNRYDTTGLIQSRATRGRRPGRSSAAPYSCWRLGSSSMRVRFLGPDTDAYVGSVERHAPEFEEQTGLDLDIQIVPSDLYFSNGIRHLLEGDGAADVYMS